MPAEHVVTIHGRPALVLAPDGMPLDIEGAANELIGEALGHRVELVVIPAERLTDDFFELRTGVAGEITQRFVNHRIRLAIVGDIEARVGGSESSRDWVAESNRGRQLWFETTFNGLTERLAL